MNEQNRTAFWRCDFQFISKLFSQIAFLEHGGVCPPLGRVIPLQIRVIDIAFRLDPAHQIHGALVAGSRALGQDMPD